MADKKKKGGQDFNEKSVTLFGNTYTISGLPKTQQSNCAVYGLAVKLTRTTAGLNSNDFNDKERSKAVNDTYEHMKKNFWNKPSEGKQTVQKKANELVATGKLSKEQMEVLTKLGLV